jgi:protein-disulfide isomerase
MLRRMRSRSPASRHARLGRLGRLAGASFALFAVACGSPKAPSTVVTELASGPPGTTTIVAFTDYECPYCRSTHLELSKAILGGPPVRIVRHHVPLPSHPHADLAARAAICAEALGARMDRMDDALFTAGSAGLHAAACEDAAADAGVADRDAFKACLHSATTDERLRRDLAVYAEAGSGGVPLTYVGKRRFEGAQDAPTFREAIAEAARK